MVSPIPDHAFFKQAQLEGLLGDDLFQVTCLAAQISDLAAGGFPCRIAGKAPFPGLEELLGPTVIEAFRDPFAAAKLGYAGFPAQTIEHDADLVFRRIVPPGGTADVLDDLLGRAVWARGFLSHLHSYVVTMRQKPSVPQDP